MPNRQITIDGRSWRVFPSGYLTSNERDEFGLIFVSGSGADRDVRITRYSPLASRAREQSLSEMSDQDLEVLFALSQSSEMSPEAGYTP